MSAPRRRPTYTFSGIATGARLALPLLPGVLVFASAFGTAAAQKGLGFWQAMSLSAIVYAGAAQMVALEVWQETWSLSTLLGVTAVTATINARMILMGASIQPWMAGAPRLGNAITLFLFTDANWLIGTRYRAEGGTDLGVMLGSGIAIWLVWVAGTVPGFLVGALVPDPTAYGLDLVMPIFFVAMLVPLWKGARSALPWLVAGAVALIVQALTPGYAFIIVGALAGALAGAFIDERR